MASSSSSFSWRFFLLPLLLLSFALLPLHLVHGSSDSHVHMFSINDVLPDSVCSSSGSAASSSSRLLQVVHRHGPCSPFSGGQKVSHRQLLRDDQARVDSFHVQVSSATAAVEKLGSSPTVSIPTRTGIPLGTGNYIVSVGFGTPRRNFSLVFDTGSDVTWIQCAPCNECYAQQEPVFDPAASSTYAALPCGSDDCGHLDSHTCSAASTCRYDVQYGDRSQTQGTFGRDTLAVSPSTADALEDFKFGCGDSNSGLFGRTAGLLGLGRGRVSLVSQAAHKYGAGFSYCLPSKSSSAGYLTIGRGSQAEANTSYTSLLTVPGLPTFYFVSLTAIKVGGKKLPVPRTVFARVGTMVDSGTVITRLPPPAYRALRAAFRKQMARYPPAPALAILDTCYDLTGHETVAVPRVALVFGMGATLDVDFSGILYMASVSQACLAFAGNERADDMAIIGNVQQRTHHVVYDVAGGKIGFGAKACN